MWGGDNLNEVTVLQCSPHAEGVSDRIAEYFSAAFWNNSFLVRQLALRDFQIHPCTGCNHCAQNGQACVYHDKDDVAYIYSILQSSILTIISAPVYFYALPAICAAFIDRAQYFWNNPPTLKSSRPFQAAILLLSAGRVLGHKLFMGAESSLSIFFRTGGGHILAKYAFRGLNCVDNLHSRPEIRETLYQKGHDWARYILLNHNKSG